MQLYANKMDNLIEIGKFLEKYNLSEPNQKEIEDMDGPITSMRIEIIIKNLPTTKAQGQMASQVDSDKNLESIGLVPILFQLFQKIIEEGKFTNSFFEATITLVPKQDKNAIHKKVKYRVISLMNIDAKVLNKSLANRIQQYIERIMHHDQVSFIPRILGFLSICKSNNVIHHINKLKDKIHIVISIDAEKAFDKIQHPFIIKTVQKVGTEGTYLNIIKTMYDKASKRYSQQ